MSDPTPEFGSIRPTPEMEQRFERAIAHKRAFEEANPDVVMLPDFWSPAFADDPESENDPASENEEE